MKLLEEFQASLQREDVSPATVQSYISDIKLFIKWLEESSGMEFKPDLLNDFEIMQYRTHLVAIKRYKPSTVNRKLSAIEKFCRFLIANGLIDKNPAEGIKQIKDETKKSPPKSLSEQEINRLRRIVHRLGKKKDIAILELLLNSGIRVSELCNLKVSDIDISERKGSIKVLGKGIKFREVPLNMDARKYIKEYLDSRPKGSTDYLFLSQKTGTKLTRTAVFEIIKKYGELAGIKISPHILRHSFATISLRKKKVDIRMLQDILGHKSLDTTARYTKPTMEDKQKAIEYLYE